MIRLICSACANSDSRHSNTHSSRYISSPISFMPVCITRDSFREGHPPTKYACSFKCGCIVCADGVVVAVVFVDGVVLTNPNIEGWFVGRTRVDLGELAIRGRGAGMTVAAVFAGEDTTWLAFIAGDDDALVLVRCTCVAGVSIFTPPLAVLCVRCDRSILNICVCCMFASVNCLIVAACPSISMRKTLTSSRSNFTTSCNSVLLL